MKQIVFTRRALSDFNNLSLDVQQRIKKKLEFLKPIHDIRSYLKPLVNLFPATHRLRIGDYRVLLGIEEKQIVIYKIGHRKEIYE